MSTPEGSHCKVMKVFTLCILVVFNGLECVILAVSISKQSEHLVDTAATNDRESIDLKIEWFDE